jgi:NAD(P)-dependent dehydrogenase (short-subunit alcohol dehydrogenase family)
MKAFKGKVAVVTGAASGIGRGLAAHCAFEGMKVVLADVEEAPLAQTETDLREAGAEVLAVRADVSKAADVEALARAALDRFGAVHLLFNNAGVAAGSSIWDSTLADWEWVLGVNLWGVIHGLRTFVPLLLAQDADAHIVNTASIAGLLPYHAGAAYQVTKHAVVALSENLYFTLAQRTTRVKASVLCPGWVNTRILECARNRPSELDIAPNSAPPDPARVAFLQAARDALETGMSPQHLAERVFDAIRKEQLYILTHPEFIPVVQQRFESILEQRNPVLPETIVSRLLATTPEGRQPPRGSYAK